MDGCDLIDPELKHCVSVNLQPRILCDSGRWVKKKPSKSGEASEHLPLKAQLKLGSAQARMARNAFRNVLFSSGVPIVMRKHPFSAPP